MRARVSGDEQHGDAGKVHVSAVGGQAALAVGVQAILRVLFVDFLRDFLRICVCKHNLKCQTYHILGVFEHVGHFALVLAIVVEEG